MKKIVWALCVGMLAAGCFSLTRTDAVIAPAVLDEAAQDIAAAFVRIRSDIEEAAAACAAAPADAHTVGNALRRLHRRHPYAADVSFIDSRGIVLAIESASRRKSAGARVSGNPLVKTMLAGHRPMLSGSFQALDGFQAAALLYPVMNGDVFSGTVTMLLRPDSMLGAIIASRIAGEPFEIWVMEAGGTILYDPDPEEIGRNLLTDSLYKPFPELRAAARLISERETGMTAYAFPGRRTGEKKNMDVFWETMTLYGRPWRIVVARNKKNGADGGKTLEHLGIKSLDEALCDFAGLKQVQQAIARRDRSRLLPLFRQWYARYPGLYSIQWVDETCTVRFGFPPENSLSNYRFDAARNAAQGAFIRAVLLGRTVSIEVPLLEGTTGLMHLCPVRSGGIYRGMVYAVRIKP